MTVAILMPYGGSDCPHRTQAYEWVTDRYRRLHGDWELVVGSCGQPWSKGAAVADAYDRTDADVLVIADADTYVDEAPLRQAVEHLTTGRTGWVVPHEQVWRLNQQATQDVYDGWTPRRQLRYLDRPAYRGVFGGGIVALTRTAYQTAGGIDPRYYGWGGEDLSFGWALHALVGLPIRGACDLWHLWHPHALGPDGNNILRGSPESEALVARYKAARRSPAEMREVIYQWTRPASSPSHAP